MQQLLLQYLKGPFAQPRKMPLIIRLILVGIMTWLTEIGGLLIWPMLSYSVDDLGFRLTLKRYLYPILSYILGSITIVPIVAAQFNFVPLPCYSSRSVLKPQTQMTCVLNRHYVKSNVRDGLLTLSRQLSRRYDNVDIRFLDGGHPFGVIPPFPNFSHRNGRSIDLAFLWKDDLGNQTTSPSPIGYGGYTNPTQTRNCSSEELLKILNIPISLRWNLTWAQSLFPKRNLDTNKTRTMISYAASNPDILAIYLEPSLHNAVGSKNGKTMANPCSWLRHDDHLQLYFVQIPSER